MTGGITSNSVNEVSEHVLSYADGVTATERLAAGIVVGGFLDSEILARHGLVCRLGGDGVLAGHHEKDVIDGGKGSLLLLDIVFLPGCF